MARHMAILDRELTAIETGANKRLIVQMPPRHGKSFLTSGYFPAHYLGVHPDRNVILTSATDELAMEFSRMGRDLLAEHGWMFGVSLRKDRQSQQRWELQQGGSLRAAGIGGAIMGRGADLLVIDDYFKDVEAALSETQRTKLYQWYLSTSSTRLSPIGAIVIMATRWHPKDLIGMVLSEAEQTGEEWRLVSFPAIGSDGAALWPEQWSATALEAKRKSYYSSGYPWMWEALYQQNPPEVLDAEWPPEYFDNIWCDDWPEDYHLCVVALDPSLGRTAKADYSAFVALKKGHDGVYYVDADIQRRPSDRIVRDGCLWMQRLRPDAFGCESVAFQDLLRGMFVEALPQAGMTMTQVFGIHGGDNSIANGRVPPKITRIRLLTNLLATGRIKVRRGSPGGALLVEQLKGFPSHKHDDGPDALEMAIRLCEELLQGSGFEAPPEMLTV
jgi:predicted phage terminase large subunit-like protein